MKTLIAALTITAVYGFSGPSMAANEWGLTNEEVVRFDGTVVDVLATLTGEPSSDCGGGHRQIGILKVDGALVLTGKNSLNFTGTTHELAEFCGQEVTVDGLMTGHSGTTFMVVQFVRPKGGEWRSTKRSIGQWSKAGWAEANGYKADGPESNRWFDNDKRILEALGKDGFLGVGKEADEAFLKE
ncbi:hypothetical protein [Limibacillus sp. MBR-115]|jgi:hypothetical protein|uniref:hypothetical protein n=1 Tax=Limibacillus sp. MBR-115 TaxID=3156465 RepID=UPI0033955AD4